MKRNKPKTTRSLLAALALSAGLLGRAEEQPQPIDGVLTFDVPEGAVVRYAEPLGADIRQLVKLGAGTLVVTNDANGAFLGTVEVRAGILEAQSALTTTLNVLGSRAENTITVSEGAQLLARVPAGKNQYAQRFPNNLVLAGNGPDGRGALLFVRSGGDWNVDHLFSNVTLAGDAGVNMMPGGRMGFNGLLDFNGHTLTYRSYASGTSDSLIFSGSQTVFRNGHLKVVNGGGVTWQDTKTFEGGPDCTVTIGQGGKLDLWGAAFAGDLWTFVFEEGTFLRMGAGTKAGENILPMPIRLDGNVAVENYRQTTNLRATLSGTLAGAGRLTMATTSKNAALWLTGTANDGWSGGLSANAGTVWATVPGSLGTGPLRAAGGTLNLPAGPGGWDFPALHAALARWDGEGAVNVYTAEGETLTDDLAFTAAIPYRHGGPGILVFAARVTADGQSKLVNGAGTMRVADCGETRYLSSLGATGGTLELLNAGRLFIATRNEAGEIVKTNTVITVGGTNADAPARLIVGEGTQLVTAEAPHQLKGAQLIVSDAGPAGAILEIRPDAVITNCFHVGQNGGQGAVYQTGGRVRNNAKAGNDGSLGFRAGSYGYWGLYDGELEIDSWYGLARSKGSVGVFEQTGGTLLLTDANLAISRGGDAEFHMSGGTFVQTGWGAPSIQLGNLSWGDKAKGPMEAVLTLAGDNPQMTLRKWISLMERTNTATSVVNLNAGVLAAPYVAKMATFQEDNKTALAPLRTDVHAYVNFGGGTFRGTGNQATLFGAGDNCADAATVFPGGATINVNGFALGNGDDVPFVRPAGKGLAAIALPPDAPTTGYIGAPKVFITATDGGAGATAHCAFDAATGTIGPIAVTSPGWGYTTPPTVQIRSADGKTLVACTATLTAGDQQPCGGLVVTNAAATAGTFTLGGVNTYTGATVVASGTLALGRADALPAANEVRCAGGTFDANGHTVSYARVGGWGALRNGSVTVTDALVFDVADHADPTRFLDVSASLQLADGATVVFTQTNQLTRGVSYTLAKAKTPFPARLASNLPTPWTVYLTDGGTTLKLHYQEGSVLFFR